MQQRINANKLFEEELTMKRPTGDTVWGDNIKVELIENVKLFVNCIGRPYGRAYPLTLS
jgi:hypothetical protein